MEAKISLGNAERKLSHADALQCSNATNLLIYQSSNWQAVEAVCECFPQAYVIPPFALIIEAIDPVDGCALMVASQQEEVLRVLDLQVQWILVAVLCV